MSRSKGTPFMATTASIVTTICGEWHCSPASSADASHPGAWTLVLCSEHSAVRSGAQLTYEIKEVLESLMKSSRYLSHPGLKYSHTWIHSAAATHITLRISCHAAAAFAPKSTSERCPAALLSCLSSCWCTNPTLMCLAAFPSATPHGTTAQSVPPVCHCPSARPLTHCPTAHRAVAKDKLLNSTGCIRFIAHSTRIQQDHTCGLESHSAQRHNA